MINKESWIYIFDNTNIRWVKVFHLYKGFHRKVTHPGFFIKGSARIVEPPRVEYKGFKYRYSIKGDICRVWLTKSNRLKVYKDKSFLFLRGSGGIIIKKKQDPKSKFLNGVMWRGIKRKKFKTLFKSIL